MSVLLKASGLESLKNRLSMVDEGALLTATNVNINRDGIIEKRRGYSTYGTSLPLTSDRVKQLFTYKGRILRHFNNVLQFDSNGSGTFSSFSGTYTETATSLRIKSIEANSNFYFTTNTGIKKISATSSSEFTSSSGYITDSGGPKGLDLIGTIVYNVGGFFTQSSSVAYRVVWGYNDANTNLILGSPSQRLVLLNLNATTPGDVSLTFSIPPDVVNTNFFYQIYRTAISDVAVDPGDEMNLVIETQVTSADILAGQITTTDVTPDDFRSGGTTLYTNPISGSGINSANEKPPIAKDIALFKGSAFFGNTTTVHRKQVGLLSVSGFTSGTSKIIIGNSTSVRKYTFVGANETATIVADTKTNTTASSYIIAYSASNERGYVFWFDKTGTDTEPSAGDTVGKILVRVDISGAAAASNVADDLKVAMNATNDFTVTRVSATLSITWVKNGNVTDTAFGSTTPGGAWSITTNTQGDGEAFNTVDGGDVLLSSLVSPSQAVDETARSLVRAINQDHSGIVYATYVSGPDDVPGLIALENRSIADITFYLAVNEVAVTQKFNPELPVNASPTAPFTSSIGSDNEKKANRLYYSKYQQPEAVPIVNYVDIGPKDKAIQRILALRDSLFILKEDGIYRLTGVYPNFSVTLFDDSTRIIAPDTAANLNNQIYLLSTQGVASVSETGVGVISRKIEDLISKVTISDFTNFATASFGVGYETDRSYTLWLPKNKTDTVAKQAFRFNTFTNTWTIWSRTDTCVVINSQEDKMYLGSGDTNYVEKERKSFNRTDYCDREFSVQVSSATIVDNNLPLGSVTNITIGDSLSQTQYLTISQFNQTLRKLELDPAVNDADYTSLNASVGVNLANKLMLLAIKLDADVGVNDTNYVASISGLTDFISIQTDYNIIVNKLNADIGVMFTNYALSVGTLTFDTTVLSTSSAYNTVNLPFLEPFLAGPATIFKGIASEITWVPQAFGDPSILKQVKEGTILFETNTFQSAEIAYSSDLNPVFEEVPFTEAGQGIWGDFVWGEQNWGGEGNSIPLRTYVPLEKQRCRYINVRFKHSNALENFSILGISLSPRVISERAYE